jgi:hypothetical protein
MIVRLTLDISTDLAPSPLFHLIEQAIVASVPFEQAQIIAAHAEPRVPDEVAES